MVGESAQAHQGCTGGCLHSYRRSQHLDSPFKCIFSTGQWAVQNLFVENKNTISDGGSTVLDTVYTVYSVYTVYNVHTVYTAYTAFPVCTVYTVFAAYNMNNASKQKGYLVFIYDMAR